MLTPVQDRTSIQARSQLSKVNLLSSHNHSEGIDEEITGITLTIHVIDMCTDTPECMMVEEIRYITQADDHLMH